MRAQVGVLAGIRSAQERSLDVDRLASDVSMQVQAHPCTDGALGNSRA